MTKKPFSEYRPLTNGVRSIDEAISEIQREMDVRRRLFDKWVEQGRMTWVDAHDRLERHMSALKWLILLSKSVDEAIADDNNPPDQAPEFIPTSELDAATAGAPA